MKIEGSFGNIKTGNETVRKLKELGFENTFVDVNDQYTGIRDIQNNTAENGVSPVLPDMAMEAGAQFTDGSRASIIATNPMMVGFGDSEKVADTTCRVVVEVEENEKDQVVQVIREMGGHPENRNL